MNNAQKTKAAMIEIVMARLEGRHITAGEACAIQAYMAILNRRQEAAFNNAIKETLIKKQIATALRIFDESTVRGIMDA